MTEYPDATPSLRPQNCPVCNYQLAGLPEPLRCPECGELINDEIILRVWKNQPISSISGLFFSFSMKFYWILLLTGLLFIVVFSTLGIALPTRANLVPLYACVPAFGLAAIATQYSSLRLNRLPPYVLRLSTATYAIRKGPGKFRCKPWPHPIRVRIFSAGRNHHSLVIWRIWRGLPIWIILSCYMQDENAAALILKMKTWPPASPPMDITSP